MEQSVKNGLAMTNHSINKEPEKIKFIFAKNLNYLLSQHDMSQSDLARKVEVTPQTVQTWVSGKSMPRGQALLRVSSVLGVEPSDIIQDKMLDIDKPKQPKRAIVGELINTLNWLDDATISTTRFNLDSETDSAVISSDNGTVIMFVTDNCSNAASVFDILLKNLVEDLEHKLRRRYLLIALPSPETNHEKFIYYCQQRDPTIPFKKALTWFSDSVSIDYLNQILMFECKESESTMKSAISVLDVPLNEHHELSIPK